MMWQVVEHGSMVSYIPSSVATENLAVLESCVLIIIPKDTHSKKCSEDLVEFGE